MPRTKAVQVRMRFARQRCPARIETRYKMLQHVVVLDSPRRENNGAKVALTATYPDHLAEMPGVD
jgi:hypothetical protein